MFKKKSALRIGRIILMFLVYLLSFPIITPLFQKKLDRNLRQKNLLDKSSSGDRVSSLDLNSQALIWRLKLIEAAEEDLVLVTFNMKDDESSQDIMSALIKAAERGVRVRILVDGMSDLLDIRFSDNIHSLASMDNVEIRIYNPINILKPWEFNYRMHDKYLISDKKAFILGGRNTKNLSLGDYPGKKDIDRDILVYNSEKSQDSSIFQIWDYFEKIWLYKKTEPFKISKKRVKKEALDNLRDSYLDLRKKWPQLDDQEDWDYFTLEAGPIKLLSNPIEAKNKEPILWADLFNIMEEGKDIMIESPYVICNKYMYKDIRELNKNRNVSFLINSIESGANRPGCSDYVIEKNRIKSTGSQVYEYVGDRSVHSKTVLIDDNISLIGSFNIDMRSTYLNTELMLVVDSPDLNRELRQQNQEKLSRSRTVTKDGQVFLGPEFKEEKLGFFEKASYYIIGIFLRPFRSLL